MKERNSNSRKQTTGMSTVSLSDEERGPDASSIGVTKKRGSKLTKEDKMGVAILLVLYTLQGIPMGLAGSVPLLLQGRVSYTEQAKFSFVTWPYSLKLLWAPIVDSVFSTRFGRRKSWVIPVQMLVGFTLLALSNNVNQLLGDPSEGTPPDVTTLTYLFLFLYFLVATQDIAVDGWALTMLSPEKVGYASTCNTVGQTAGYFISFTVFLAFNSPEFCNKYLCPDNPQPEGLLTLADFMRFWGWVFIVVTLLLAVLKQERSEDEKKRGSGSSSDGGTGSGSGAGAGPTMSVKQAYLEMWRVMCLPSVRSLVLVLLTCRLAFAAESVTSLKLLEYGVPKEYLGLMGVALFPVELAFPVIMSRYTAGPSPLSLWQGAYAPRIVASALFMAVLAWMPSQTTMVPAAVVTVAQEGEELLRGGAGAETVVELSNAFYGVLMMFFVGYRLLATLMFVSAMAFYARVSDPTIGGTYMTLLNTVTNLGANWPTPIALALLDSLTVKACVVGGGEDGGDGGGRLDDALSAACGEAGASAAELENNACVAAGGSCETERDGFYALSVVSAVLGVLWLVMFTPRLRRLQELAPESWKVKKSQE